MCFYALRSRFSIHEFSTAPGSDFWRLGSGRSLYLVLRMCIFSLRQASLVMFREQRSLKQYLRDTYGDNIQRLTSQLESTMLKVARFKNHLTFNLRCLHHHILPHDLRIRSPVNTPHSQTILRRAGFHLLRERVSLTRSILRRHSTKAEWLERSLTGTLSQYDLECIMHLCNRSYVNTFHATKNKQIQKFVRMTKAFHPTTRPCQVSTERWVTNLSSETLSSGELSLLRKGFSVPPSRFPLIDFIVPIENALRRLPSSTADAKRSAVFNVLKKTQLPKSNLSNEERRALSSLR